MLFMLKDQMAIKRRPYGEVIVIIFIISPQNYAIFYVNMSSCYQEPFSSFVLEENKLKLDNFVNYVTMIQLLRARLSS